MNTSNSLDVARACCKDEAAYERLMTLWAEALNREASALAEWPFRRIADAAPVFVWTCGPDGLFTYVNRTWLVYTGSTPERELASGWLDGVHPDERERIARAFAETLHDREVFRAEFRLRKADGTYGWVLMHGSPLFAANGTFRGFAGSCTDISEQLKAEEDLDRSQRYAQCLIDSSLDMIISVDMERRIAEFNRAAEITFGYRREEILGQPVDLLYSDPEEGARISREVLRSGNFVGEVRNRRANGATFPSLLSASIVRDPDGRPIGLMGISRDITEQKRTERELVRAKEAAEAASRAKSEFLANTSHELRTPLNAILGYSEMLKEELEVRGLCEIADDVEQIRLSAGQLLSSINDILDYSKLESGQRALSIRPFDVAELVRDLHRTAQPMADHNENTLACDVSDEIGEMVSDRAKVRRCLMSLISNACKFTSRGDVRLSARREARDGRDWIVFTVKDTGIGMDPESVPRMMEPFTQGDSSDGRKYSGTGLGLALSGRLCQALGGTLEVATHTGQGATVAVRLPARLDATNGRNAP